MRKIFFIVLLLISCNLFGKDLSDKQILKSVCDFENNYNIEISAIFYDKNNCSYELYNHSDMWIVDRKTGLVLGYENRKLMDEIHYDNSFSLSEKDCLNNVMKFIKARNIDLKDYRKDFEIYVEDDDYRFVKRKKLPYNIKNLYLIAYFLVNNKGQIKCFKIENDSEPVIDQEPTLTKEEAIKAALAFVGNSNKIENVSDFSISEPYIVRTVHFKKGYSCEVDVYSGKVVKIVKDAFYAENLPKKSPQRGRKIKFVHRVTFWDRVVYTVCDYFALICELF